MWKIEGESTNTPERSYSTKKIIIIKQFTRTKRNEKCLKNITNGDGLQSEI